MKLVQLPPPFYKGSVKTLHDLEDGTLAFRFSDDWSAFDVGKHPQPIPEKGQAVCACAVKSFKIAQSIGVPTHFIEALDPVTIRVNKLQVITDRPLQLTDHNYVVPAEWIFRFHVAGSIDRAFRQPPGSKDYKNPRDYGFATSQPPAVGTPFPWPVQQFTTKFEKTDREIDEAEARRLAGLSAEDVTQFWAMIHYLNGAINSAIIRAGFCRLDGKIECGLGPNRQKMIVDVTATSDEDRPVAADELKSGSVFHYNKEMLRQKLIQMGYHEALKTARAADQPDPPYPHLEPDFIDQVGKRYQAFAEAYTAVSI